MSAGSYQRRSSTTAKPRWMALKFAGKCDVCGVTLPAGATAFWHGRGQGVTCHGIDCCTARGLTTEEWVGSPVSGRYVTVRAARPLVYSGHRPTGGRCTHEDYPCCGC